MTGLLFGYLVIRALSLSGRWTPNTVQPGISHYQAFYHFSTSTTWNAQGPPSTAKGCKAVVTANQVSVE